MTGCTKISLGHMYATGHHHCQEHSFRHKYIQGNWAVSWLLNPSARTCWLPLKSRLKIKRWTWLCHPDFLNMEQCAGINLHLWNCLACEFLISYNRWSSFIILFFPLEFDELYARLTVSIVSKNNLSVAAKALTTDKTSAFSYYYFVHMCSSNLGHA